MKSIINYIKMRRLERKAKAYKEKANELAAQLDNLQKSLGL